MDNDLNNTPGRIGTKIMQSNIDVYQYWKKWIKDEHFLCYFFY